MADVTVSAIESMNKFFEEYKTAYADFKAGTKKSGLVAKKALTEVKKLIIAARREIRDEVDASRKKRE
jgi:hypothetical protein